MQAGRQVGIKEGVRAGRATPPEPLRAPPSSARPSAPCAPPAPASSGRQPARQAGGSASKRGGVGSCRAHTAPCDASQPLEKGTVCLQRMHKCGQGSSGPFGGAPCSKAAHAHAGRPHRGGGALDLLPDLHQPLLGRRDLQQQKCGTRWAGALGERAAGRRMRAALATLASQAGRAGPGLPNHNDNNNGNVHAPLPRPTGTRRARSPRCARRSARPAAALPPRAPPRAPPG